MNRFSPDADHPKPDDVNKPLDLDHVKKELLRLNEPEYVYNLVRYNKPGYGNEKQPNLTKGEFSQIIDEIEWQCRNGHRAIPPILGIIKILLRKFPEKP